MNKELDWKQLLEAALETHSQSEIAKKIGYSRTAVNLVVSGKYLGSTKQIAQRVIEVFGAVDCPFLNKEISLEECTQHSCGKAPMHNPMKMQHWRACLSCPKRPTGEKE